MPQAHACHIYIESIYQTHGRWPLLYRVAADKALVQRLFFSMSAAWPLLAKRQGKETKKYWNGEQ